MLLPTGPFQLLSSFQECAKYLTNAQITEFLDGAIRNRISVRLIAEQHISLSRAIFEPGHYNPGIVHANCSPADMVRMCGSFVSELCNATLGAAPAITIDGDKEAEFA